MGRTPQEAQAAEEAAKRYVLAKQQEAAAQESRNVELQTELAKTVAVAQENLTHALKESAKKFETVNSVSPTQSAPPATLCQGVADVPPAIDDTAKAAEPDQFYSDRRQVSSCVLAHAVTVRGVETRMVSKIKLDFKSAGLEILEDFRGLKVSYVGQSGKRETFITPWANVVEYRY